MSAIAPACTEGREAFLAALKNSIFLAANDKNLSVVSYLNQCLPGLGDRWRQSGRLKQGITRNTFNDIVRWGLVGKIDKAQIQMLELDFYLFLDATKSTDGRKQTLKGEAKTRPSTSKRRINNIFEKSSFTSSDFKDSGFFVAWSTELVFNLSKDNKNKESINTARAILHELHSNNCRFIFKSERQRRAAMVCFLGASCLIAIESMDIVNANLFLLHLSESAQKVRDSTSVVLSSICEASIARNFSLPFEGSAEAHNKALTFSAYAAANSGKRSVFKIEGLSSLATIEVGRDSRFAKEGLDQFDGNGNRTDFLDALLAQIGDEENASWVGAGVARYAALCMTLACGLIASPRGARFNFSLTLLALCKNKMIERSYYKHLTWIDWYTCCAAAMKAAGNVVGYTVALQRAQEIARTLNISTTEQQIITQLQETLVAKPAMQGVIRTGVDMDELLIFLSQYPPSLIAHHK